MEILIPLFGIVFSIGLPLALVIVVIALNYRKRRALMQLHHVERMAAIERGMDLPPLPLELIDGGSSRRRSTSLLPGLIWFFVGLTMTIALRAAEWDGALIGLVPAGVGLAYLIYYLVEGRRIEARLLENELRDRAAPQK